MLQETAISKAITKLSDVRSKFNLTRSDDQQFFREWLGELPEIAESDKLLLQRLKTPYLYYLEEEEKISDMMGNPHSERASFGMISNGEDYIFVKLTRTGANQYALSDKFTIFNNHSNGLNQAMRVLKQLSSLSLQS